MIKHADTPVLTREELEKHIARARRLRSRMLREGLGRATLSVRNALRKIAETPPMSRAQEEQMIRTMPVF